MCAMTSQCETGGLTMQRDVPMWDQNQDRTLLFISGISNGQTWPILRLNYLESIQSLLKWHWSVIITDGVLDLSLVNEERLQKYLAPYVGENGKPSLDFRGIEEESPVYRLVAVKQVTSAREEYNG